MVVPIFLALVACSAGGQGNARQVTPPDPGRTELKTRMSMPIADEARYSTYRHETLIHDNPKHFRGTTTSGGPSIQTTGVTLKPRAGQDATYESQPLEPGFPFNELLLSWNVYTPRGAGFRVEARVGRTSDDFWGPWLFFGEWGDAPPAGERSISFALGRVDVDYFRGAERFSRLQYRVRAAAQAADGAEVHVDRIAACVSDTTGAASSAPPNRQASLGADHWQRRLPVPERSQKSEAAEIAGRICSPTSLSMVMAFYGVDRPTRAVADACFDGANGIYGNWPRNIQAAASLGVPGYLTRISSWAEAERFIADGRPLIASIRVDTPGALKGSPYPTTDGHLLVICGFDRDGNVEVNDPAAPPGGTAMRYSRQELGRAWFGGSGGVAYVLLPAAKRR
jgi:hypothetical protein